MSIRTEKQVAIGSGKVGVVRESVGRRGMLKGTSGLRGSVMGDAARVVEGPTRVAGKVVCEPTAREWETWLPWVQGSVKDGQDEFQPGPPAEFVMWVDRGAKVFRYEGCKVAKAVVRGCAGEAVQLEVEVEALRETAGEFPVLETEEDAGYLHAQGVFTLGGEAREVFEFEVRIDHQLDTERWMNSTERSHLISKGREVRWKVWAPFSAEEVEVLQGSVGGLEATLLLTNGEGCELLFTSEVLQFAVDSPQGLKGEEVLVVLQGVARKAGNGADLVIRQTLV